MRTVSVQEAQACRERMLFWAKSDKPSSGGSLGEWVYTPSTPQSQTPEAVAISPQVAQACREHIQLLTSDKPLFNGLIEECESKPVSFPRQAVRPPNVAPAFVMAKTPGAAQQNWRIPSEFPCCPQEAGEEPIATYAQRLKIGAIFARNDLSVTAVLKFAMTDDRNSLWVICEKREENSVKPWALAQITYEDGLYVHTSRGTFFSIEGAEKHFCLALGLEWTGGDSIDDYC